MSMGEMSKLLVETILENENMDEHTKLITARIEDCGNKWDIRVERHTKTPNTTEDMCENSDDCIVCGDTGRGEF